MTRSAMLATTALPRPIHAVVFDMDGLLIDTERHVKLATLETATAIGRPMPEEFYAGIIGTPWTETVTLLRDFFGGEDNLRAFMTAFEPRVTDLLADVELMTGVVDLLDTLDQIRMPLAVATSTGRLKADQHLRHVGIHHRFRTIVTRDDVTRGKPHPEPYLTAAARLGVDPAHCLALEDSHNGIRAAHAAGMMAVMVPDMLPATAEISALCQYVADDLHGVRRLICP